MDGVALAAATVTRVLLGTRFAVAAAWVVAAFCLAVACLGAGAGSRPRAVGGSSAVLGVLVLITLLASGGAAAAVRATAVRGGVLLAWVRQPSRVEVSGTVAEDHAASASAATGSCSPSTRSTATARPTAPANAPA